MGKALGLLVSKLPATWQAGLTITGAIGVGFVFALTLVGWIGIPATVAQLKEAAATATRTDAEHERRLDAVESDARWVRCFLGAQASGENPIARCGL